eukprot:1500940-Amphidinium_carterae.1
MQLVEAENTRLCADGLGALPQLQVLQTLSCDQLPSLVPSVLVNNEPKKAGQIRSTATAHLERGKRCASQRPGGCRARGVAPSPAALRPGHLAETAGDASLHPQPWHGHHSLVASLRHGEMGGASSLT